MDGVRSTGGGEGSVTDSVRAETEEDLINNTHGKEESVIVAPQASSDETRAPEETDAPSEPFSSTQHRKSRTFSMEMTDAIEALHRKEEEEEDNVLEIIEGMQT
jgi:hypothetical protein